MNSHAKAKMFDHVTSMTLKLIGAINVLFATALILTAFGASVGNTTEAQPKTCGGENLLAQLQETDLDAYMQIVEEAASVPFGQSLLYKIEKDGVPPSWLFGTMHMTDPRIVQLSAKAENAFAQADTLIIESDEILDMTKAQVALLSRPDLQMFTDGQRLSDFITDEQRETLKAGLEKRGLQLALIDRMKPWMVTGLVALPACEMARKQAGEPFLDIALAERAKADGKAIRGLETIVEQLDAMASLPLEFHVNGLVETVKLGAVMDDVIETMVQLYLKEKVAAVMPTLERVAAAQTGSADESGYAAFEEKIVVNRNYIMAERAQPYLDQGSVFLAVGALHLPGKEGVAQLLQNAGYTVTPVIE